MQVQIWSHNFAPEPTGIGPVSQVLAQGLNGRGHSIEVLAAHPHYPEAKWGHRLLPYRETTEGYPVIRLPLWIGRRTTLMRVRQDLSFLMVQSAALPIVRRPDVMIVASPSFPALLPAMVHSKWKGVPWVLWLHDILPDGAVSTSMMKDGGGLLAVARGFELRAYRSAARIVVLSESCRQNLIDKEVNSSKIQLIYTPATREPVRSLARGNAEGPPRLLTMGNVGHTQNLVRLIRAFEASSLLAEVGVRFVILGTGVEAQAARAAIRSDRVEMPGVVEDGYVESELRRATVALVSQRYMGAEFNIPSKTMNFMIYGLPILAMVNPHGAIASMIEESGAGWVVDSSYPDLFPQRLAQILGDPVELARRGRAGREFAIRRFTKEEFARRFDEVLREVV